MSRGDCVKILSVKEARPRGLVYINTAGSTRRDLMTEFAVGHDPRHPRQGPDWSRKCWVHACRTRAVTGGQDDTGGALPFKKGLRILIACPTREISFGVMIQSVHVGVKRGRQWNKQRLGSGSTTVCLRAELSESGRGCSSDSNDWQVEPPSVGGHWLAVVERRKA